MVGGLVELPSGTEEHGNYRAILRSADHGKPLVTAISGFKGPVVRLIERKEAEAPIPGDLLDDLEGIPTSYILVHDSWLFPESRLLHRDWLARGMAAGRLRFIKRFDGRMRNELYAVVRNEPEAKTLEPLPWNPAVGHVPAPPLHREDPTLTGSIDEPVANAVVTGPLKVRGWARIPGEDLHVTVTIDGEERPFVHGSARAASGPPGCPAIPRRLPDRWLRSGLRLRARRRRGARPRRLLPVFRRARAPLPAAHVHLETRNVESPRMSERLRRLLPEFLVCLAFLGLTAVMTWPWVLHLRDHCSDTGDPYLVSWTLWWDFHQTFHDPLHLFDGNVSFPMKYSLAFSEHNYGIALPFFPLLALGVRPLTVQGLATLLGFAFSGYGAFRLARTLTGSTGAAWVTGIAFAFVPYRFGQTRRTFRTSSRAGFRSSSRPSSFSCAKERRNGRRGSGSRSS